MGADCPDLHHVGADRVEESVGNTSQSKGESPKPGQVAHLGVACAVRVAEDGRDDVGQEQLGEPRVVPSQLLQIAPGGRSDLIAEGQRLTAGSRVAVRPEKACQ